MKHVKAGAIAVTALTLSLCLSGCQSDENADGASGDQASAAPSTTKSPYAGGELTARLDMDGI